MRSKAERSSLFRRVEVRLGLGLATAIGLLLVVLVSFFFLLATHETAELLEEGLAHDLESALARDARGAPPETDEAVAVRRIDPGGGIRLLQGQWPESGAFFPVGSSSLRLAFADPHDHLVLERSLGGGTRLVATTSLAAFVGERREQRGQLLASLAFSIAGLLVVSVVATRLALAPIRAATRAVEGVDEHHLDQRIPVRGTGDDLDRHARALNRVLTRLEVSFQRMQAFSADVAHELRTPVNRMLNLTDLAILRGAVGTSTSELAPLREAAEEMRCLIDDLLLLAKGDAGRLAARHDRVALAPLLEGLASLFRPAFDERKVALLLDAKERDLCVRGDAALLQRAIANLLDNAVRFTPEGGQVSLSAAQEGDRAIVDISDSGPGIDEPDRQRIFERFVQLDPARAGEGAGLGLALVRMIVRAHGGSVGVEASDAGGARFRITVPVAAA